MGPEAVADLIQRARRHKVRSIVDVEKDVLAAAIAAGADIVKPTPGGGRISGSTRAGVDAALFGGTGDRVSRRPAPPC
jgi:hypothetical protein